MLLRESGKLTGHSFDLQSITDSSAAVTSGVPHAEALVAFAEAVVGMDETSLENARARVLNELGPEALVDAAGVASNFERMVRVADATGIPLDRFLADATVELRQDLGLDEFHSVTNAV